MSYSLYLGCLIPSRLPYLEKSLYVLMEKLGIEYSVSDEYSCCCDPIIGKSLSLDTWLAIAARNITVAEAEGHDILTTCNGCFSTLNEANHILKENQALKAQVNETLKDVGREFKGTAEVVPLTKVMHELGQDRIKGLVSNGLDYKVASHYGCHLILPERTAGIDNSRHPAMLDELAEWVGVTPVNYSSGPKCCGSGLNTTGREASSEMLTEIIGSMIEKGATHILTPCPFCFMQFDQGQAKEEKKLPVLYISELYDLAFGSSADEIGLKYHRVPVSV
jgi:heterodisulfide reductase subunit B